MSLDTGTQDGPSEILQRLSVFLEPEELACLVQDLGSLRFDEKPAVDYESRLQFIRPTAWGKSALDVGKITLKFSGTKLTFSELLDVEWHKTLNDQRRVMVQASASPSQLGRPHIMMVEGTRPSTLVDGRVLSLREPQAIVHLTDFHHDLALAGSLAYRRWYAPREDKGPSNLHRFIDGEWRKIDI
jgi:hypothetical protein